MKKGMKATIACLASIIAVSLMGCSVPTEQKFEELKVPLPVTDVAQPNPAGEVQSVVIQYDGKNADGYISTPFSVGKIRLTAVVLKDEGANGAVAWQGDNPAVAAVDDSGLVTFTGAGQTVITARAGDKECEVLLDITLGGSMKYSLTLTNCQAAVDGKNTVSADPGDYVALTAILPEGKDIDYWELTTGETVRKLHSNGFIMPEEPVAVAPIFKNRFYKLNIVGGTSLDEEQKGLDSGVDDNGNRITTYSYEYGDTVTVKADTAPTGKIFVGWDKDFKNSRFGAPGADEYTFEMLAQDMTLFANYGNYTKNVILPALTGTETVNRFRMFKPGTTEGDYILAGKSGVSTEDFKNGATASTAAADPDLEGLSGYRLHIPGSMQTDNTSASENIANSTRNFNSMNETVMMKAIFKNHSDRYDVTLSWTIGKNGHNEGSGEVSVPAGQTVVHCFNIGLGFGYAWSKLILHEKVDHGSGDPEETLVDFVLGQAIAFPDGDPTTNNKQAKNVLIPSNIASNIGGEVQVGAGGKYIKPMFMKSQVTDDLGKMFHAFKITNMPKYEEIEPSEDGKRYTVIYLKAQGNIATSMKSTFVCGIEKNVKLGDALSVEESVSKKAVTVGGKDDAAALCAVKIERTEDDVADNFYFTFQIRDISELLSGWNNLTISCYYNNVIAYGGEV